MSGEHGSGGVWHGGRVVRARGSGRVAGPGAGAMAQCSGAAALSGARADGRQGGKAQCVRGHAWGTGTRIVPERAQERQWSPPVAGGRASNDGGRCRSKLMTSRKRKPSRRRRDNERQVGAERRRMRLRKRG